MHTVAVHIFLKPNSIKPFGITVYIVCSECEEFNIMMGIGVCRASSPPSTTGPSGLNPLDFGDISSNFIIRWLTVARVCLPYTTCRLDLRH